MFASHAAMAIANARRHREEQRARANLETLVDTTPVGVVVFNAGPASGVPQPGGEKAGRRPHRPRPDGGAAPRRADLPAR